MTQNQPQQQRNAEATLIALYVAAQTVVLSKFAHIISRMVPGTDGANVALTKMRRVVRPVVSSLAKQTPPLIEQVVREAVEPSNEPSESGEPWRSHAEVSAAAIRADLTSELQDARYRITRYPDDVYKRLVAAAAEAQVKGSTAREAQAQAWRELSREGVTGFVDRRGRTWELSAYVEMAVRTATQRAFNEAHLQRMQAMGHQYFTVTDDGAPCPKCLPWQWAILTVEPIPNPVMHVDGTIAEARAAGLFHPECRHHLIAPYEGMPARRTWTPADERTYRATQTQRRHEREVRKAKRAAEYAPSAESKRAVRQAQARLRAHVNETGSIRYSRREQLDLGNK